MAQEKLDITESWPLDQEDMHICPRESCGAEMIQPVDYEKAADTGTYERWVMRLYCGECETFFKGVFNERQIDRFDARIEKYEKVLKNELLTLEADSMHAWGEIFTAALDADLVDPEDFTLPSG
jgi:hypothetical protein